MAESSNGPDSDKSAEGNAALLPLRFRLAVAGLVAGVVLAVLLWWLGQPGPAFSTRPFLREPTVHKAWTIVRLAVRPLPDGTFEETGTVRVEPGADLDRAAAISFQLDLYREGTNSGHVVLVADAVSGEATSADGTVRFAIPPHSQVPEKVLVRMDRQSPMGQGADVRELKLRFVTRGDRRLALECNTVDYFPDSLATNTWSWVRGPGQTKVFAPPGSPVFASLPIGQFIYPLQGPNLSRAEIIAFLWEFNDADKVRWVLCILCVMFGVGLAGASWGRNRIAVGALGIALMFGSVSATYALLSPPLGAPDEQDHFLSFYSAIGVGDAREKVKELASRSHWERRVPITSPFEKISADDTRQSYQTVTRDWATSGLVARERSGLGGHYWRSIAPFVVRDSTSLTLLRLRWANAATVSAAVFVSAMLLLMRRENRLDGHWGPLVLVLIPAVAYLAMASSNYILLVGCGLALAGALFPGRPTTVVDTLSWFIAALGAGIAIQCSRSALSLVGLLPVVGWRWVRSMLEPDRSRRSSVCGCWVAIAAGLIVPWFASAPDYRAEVLDSIQRLGGQQVGEILSRLAFPGWVVASAVAAAAIELTMRSLGRRRGAALERLASSASVSGWLMPVLLVVVVVWFQSVKIPPTATNGRELPLLTHVVLGLGKFLGSLGPGQHDFLLSLTFWNTLGWLEVKLPEWSIDLLGTVALIGFSLNWAIAARRRDGAGFVQNAVLTLACFAYLGAMLAASRAAGYTLVGRYMVMFFTIFLAYCWNGWLPVLGRFGQLSPRIAFASWAALPAVLHLFCWSRIVGHFF